MDDFVLIAVALGAVVVGVLGTLVVQWANAIRDLSREATATFREVKELIELLQPAAQRISNLSEVLHASQTDVLAMQRSLHVLADGSVELAAAVSGARRWVNTLTPVVMASLEYLARHRPDEGAGERERAAEPGAVTPAANEAA